jgi:excisionase family DNA binding protein
MAVSVPTDRLLTEDEAAELLATKPQTLSVWRTTKRYPLPYVKVGRNVRYKLSAVLAFIEARTVSVSYSSVTRLE